MFKAVLLAATAQAVQLRKFDPLATSCYSPEDSGPSVSPDNGLGNHGYCRNPDNKHAKPYCYPMDTPGETEECNIDECPVDTRDVQQEAADVATYVGSHDCECAAQLFGSTTTTADTSVAGALLQKTHLKRLTVQVVKDRAVTMSQIKQLCQCH